MVALLIQHNEWRTDNGALLQLIVQPILKQMMISTQKNDVEL